MNAAVGTTIVISSHDPRGTTTNLKAGIDLGGRRTTSPYRAKEASVRKSVTL
jgi:hypothetical protein